METMAILDFEITGMPPNFGVWAAEIAVAPLSVDCGFTSNDTGHSIHSAIRSCFGLIILER